MESLRARYPICCRCIKDTPLSLRSNESGTPTLGPLLDAQPQLRQAYPFLDDLARIEEARYALANSPLQLPEQITVREINPNVHLIDVQWQRLPELIYNPDITPVRGDDIVIVWQKNGEDKIRTASAHAHELLALKLISEQITSREAALEANISVGTIDDILFQAERKGLLLAPPSKIVRSPEFPRGSVTEEKFFTTPTFTLQWHITQTCDLHCRHCYDRSPMADPDLKECIKVLDELYDFCQEHNVVTQVTFTGGNPLLYPHFDQLYQEAADRGFLTAILGNPMPRQRIEEIKAIQKPEFYQVSLEGLLDQNDYIRGQGHFDRVLHFLDLLRELDIYSMVMLTLTRANMGQVLDLAELLREMVDLFTFNRLAMVGEGAALASVPPEEYRTFLESYLAAAEHNPCMGLKDNLINILFQEKNKPLFGGCAGRGCGAAFNFVALLPNGEVHACRKFPSPIGNLQKQSFTEIYYGELARRYRSGTSACTNCSIRPVCGGCLAVTHGFGLDIFSDRDPYCCIDSLQTSRS